MSNQIFDFDLTTQLHTLVNSELLSRYANGKSGAVRITELAGLCEANLEQLFPSPVVDRNLACCCVAGIWLLHHEWDRSHSISQNIETAEGSFWHAIMHRWEGDYSNAKYWYRRVGAHPVLRQLAQQFQLAGKPWQANAMVDAVEQDTRQNSPAGTVNERLQSLIAAEWLALFRYCYLGATGTPTTSESR